MAKSFRQAVTVAGTPTKIYRSLLDDKVLSELSELKTKVSIDETASKIVFGELKATVLLNAKNKMLILKGKTKSWEKGALDAIITIAITKGEDTSSVEVFSTNVPDANTDEIKAIWKSIIAAIKKSVK